MARRTGCLSHHYIVSAATYRKLRHLHSPDRLDFFLESLFAYANEFAWDLRA